MNDKLRNENEWKLHHARSCADHIEYFLAILRNTELDHPAFSLQLLDYTGYLLRITGDLKQAGIDLPEDVRRTLRKADRWLKKQYKIIESALKAVSLDTLEEDIEKWSADFENGWIHPDDALPRFELLLDMLTGFYARFEVFERYLPVDTCSGQFITLKNQLEGIVSKIARLAADDPHVSDLVRNYAEFAPGGDWYPPWPVILSSCDDPLFHILFQETIRQEDEHIFLLPDKVITALAASGQGKTIFPQRRLILYSGETYHVELALIDGVLMICLSAAELKDSPVPVVTRQGEQVSLTRFERPYEVRYIIDIPLEALNGTVITIAVKPFLPPTRVKIQTQQR